MRNNAEALHRDVVAVGALVELVGGRGASARGPPEPEDPLGTANRRTAIDDDGPMRTGDGSLAAERGRSSSENGSAINIAAVKRTSREDTRSHQCL